MGKRKKIRAVLDAHEAYTVIYYGDNDERVGYQCQCGEKDEPDGELFGRSWLVNHQTNEIVKVL